MLDSSKEQFYQQFEWYTNSIQNPSHQELKAIQDSINELNSFFTAVHILTFSQGELADRIDHNIEQAMHSNQGTVRQLERAISKTKSSFYFRKIFYFLLLCVFGFIMYWVS